MKHWPLIRVAVLSSLVLWPIGDNTGPLWGPQAQGPLFRLGPLISGTAPVTYHPEAIDAWNRAGSNGPAVYLEAMSDLAYFYETNNLRGKVWRLDVFPGTSIVSMAATLFHGTNAAHVHGFTNLLNVGLAAGNCFPSNGFLNLSAATYFNSGANLSAPELADTGHLLGWGRTESNTVASVGVLCGSDFWDIQSQRRALTVSAQQASVYGNGTPWHLTPVISNFFMGYGGSNAVINSGFSNLVHPTMTNATSVRYGMLSNRSYTSSGIYLMAVQFGSYLTTNEIKLCRQAISNFNLRVGRPTL